MSEEMEMARLPEGAFVLGEYTVAGLTAISTLALANDLKVGWHVGTDEFGHGVVHLFACHEWDMEQMRAFMRGMYPPPSDDVEDVEPA